MGSYQDIINKRKKDWNCSQLMDRASRGKKLAFSSPLLNYATYGGIPRAAVTEFFGDPGGGKSTTAVDICKNAHKLFDKEYNDKLYDLQMKANAGDKSALVAVEDLSERGPKKVLYIDLEHSFDDAWAKTLGIVQGELDIMQPPDVVAEEVLQTVQELIESGEVGLLVLDSIPSLVTKQELEKKLGERTVASVAGLLTIFFRKIVPILTRYDCTLLVINQTRDNMDNPYVVNTPGGRALKFYATLRMYFKIGTPVDFLGNDLPANAENPAGYIVNAKIVKQKSAPWDRKLGSYYLMAQSGIRVDMDFCQLAVKKYGIIKKAGAWFSLCNPETGEILADDTGKPVKLNGMAKVLEYMQTHPDYFEILQKYIIDDIEHNSKDDAEGGVEADDAY